MTLRTGLGTTGLLAAAATALFGLTVAAAPNALAAPKLTISDSTVSAGQTVTVKGSGFPAKPTSLFVTICANPPGATNCDVDLRHVTQLQYDGSGSFTTKYKVAVTKFSSAAGEIDCAKVQCVIGSTNALAPKDHAYNAVAKFSVAGKQPTTAPSKQPTPTPTASSGATTGSSTSPSASAEPVLPHTGGSGMTPLVAAGAGAAVLAGLVLVVASSRRRSHH